MRKKTFLSTTTLILILAALGLGGGAAAAAVQLTVPSAPSNLTATTISTSSITLNWTDNSSNEDGFNIEMCQGSGCTDFAFVGGVPAGATNATASGLAKGRTYSFRVYAYNSAGNSSYSNVAEATTLLH